jgi:hypothetical protein
MQTPHNITEIPAFVKAVESVIQASLRSIFDKIVKMATKSYVMDQIWKKKNAKLRSYNSNKRVQQPGGRTQLSKAKVIDDEELQAKINAAEERVTRLEAAKVRKQLRDEAMRAMYQEAVAEDAEDDENVE